MKNSKSSLRKACALAYSENENVPSFLTSMYEKMEIWPDFRANDLYDTLATVKGVIIIRQTNEHGHS